MEDKQCDESVSWPTVKGIIQPIISNRNRLNQIGIKYRFGKKKGQLKKNKLLTIEEMEQALAEAQV